MYIKAGRPLVSHCDIFHGTSQIHPAGSYDEEGIFYEDVLWRTGTSGMAVGPSFDETTAQATVSVTGVTLEPNAWVGYVMHFGITNVSVITENTTNTVSMWGDFEYLGTPIAFEIRDYRLSSSSPCIDAGTPSVASATSDWQDESWPADAFNGDGDWDPLTGDYPDIGADEYWEYDPPVFAGLQEIVLGCPQPLIQAVFDVFSPTMAFDRVCLLGDAASTVRPHIAAGQAKACADAWALRNALEESEGAIAPALSSWQDSQVEVARKAWQRSRKMGVASQFDKTMVPGDPDWLFGLWGPGN